jgi:hypothetical protein
VIVTDDDFADSDLDASAATVVVAGRTSGAGFDVFVAEAVTAVSARSSAAAAGAGVSRADSSIAAVITQKTTTIAPTPIIRFELWVSPFDPWVSAVVGSSLVSAAMAVVLFELAGLFARVGFFGGITSSMPKST